MLVTLHSTLPGHAELDRALHTVEVVPAGVPYMNASFVCQTMRASEDTSGECYACVLFEFIDAN